MIEAIRVHLDSSPAAAARAQTALDLAQRLKAKLRGMVIAAEPMAPYGPGAGSLNSVIADMHARIGAEAHAIQTQARDSFGIEADIVDTLSDRVVIDAASLMRADDLVLIGAPQRDKSFLDNDVFEAALFASGRPCILVPAAWSKPLGLRVVIAWKDCREAARAVHDALPILMQAASVRMVSVISHDEHRFFGQAAFDRMSDMLRGRGVKLEDGRIIADEPNAAAALQREAKDADLLVMGGYGNWRIGEYLFGGMTRHAITHLETPVFMSR